MDEMQRSYSLWNNLQFVTCWLKKMEGKQAIAIGAADVVMRICLPFLEMALPGFVMACLIGGGSAGISLLLIAAYVGVLQTVRFLQSHIYQKREKILFMFRMDMGGVFKKLCLEVDGQFVESSTGQKKIKDASAAVYTGDLVGIKKFTSDIMDTIFNLGGLAIYAVIVGYNSLILLGILVLQTVLSAAIHSTAQKQSEKEDWSTFDYLRKETIAPGNGKDIRMYRMDRWLLAEMEKSIDEICGIRDHEQRKIMLAEMMERILAFIRNIFLYLYLFWQMSQGKFGISGFLLYVGVVSGFGSWMTGMFDAVQSLFQNRSYICRLQDFFEEGQAEEAVKTAVAEPGKVHEIRFENVCFRYEGSAEDMIHDLNLTIRPGEKLALVGANGAGKTTLVKLMCGLYRPDSGRVLLDGQEMKQILSRELFREFGVVFQDVFAFSFSLADNVSGKETERTDQNRLEESLRSAGLWERVKELPEGQDTALNRDLEEDGVQLSGGELQKLMLARALYKNAPIMILDEPTAALDPIAESEMYHRYQEMLSGKTGIFISHRLSSTQFCDRILFLENGRIVEEGTHEELLEKRGKYREMFDIQARYYREGEV